MQLTMALGRAAANASSLAARAALVFASIDAWVVVTNAAVATEFAVTYYPVVAVVSPRRGSLSVALRWVLQALVFSCVAVCLHSRHAKSKCPHFSTIVYAQRNAEGLVGGGGSFICALC
jgi:hypothetical protein